MERKQNLEKIKKLVNKCQKLNSAYIIKHNELMSIYNAFVKLSIKCNYNVDIINDELNIIIDQYSIIPRKKFICMINQQKKWMRELKSINHKVDEIIGEIRIL